MKKYILGILILIAFIAFFWLKTSHDESKKAILGDNITLISYSNGNAALGIDFLESKDTRSKLSMAIDSDNSGTFEDSEWLVKNVPVLPKAEKKNKVYFLAPDDFGGELKVLVHLDDAEITKNVEVSVANLLDNFGLDTITNPEEAMKGLTNIALAEEELIEITQEGVSDINQKPGECAPTSAVNGLTALINKHGTPDNKITNTEELIEELKTDMKWNMENGVTPDNFVIGKNLWAARHGLPIRTTKVGDKDGITTIDEIRDALANGDSVELRIKFADAELKSVGGHMVSLTGLYQGEGQTYIDINDPYTPGEEGAETVEIRSNRITNYGPFKGLTIVSWGFIQTWETPLGSGTALEPLTDTEVSGLSGEFGKTETTTTMQSSFSHVKPGEYSEVYAAVTTTSGEEITLSLDGPGVVGPKRQIIVADDNGQAHFTWKINLYGNYTLSGNGGGVDLNSTVSVN